MDDSLSGKTPLAMPRTMVLCVVERANGNPISEAEVQVPYLDPPQAYRTDSEGVCRIVLTAPLTDGLGIFVQKRGFVPMRVVWELSERSTPLPADYTLPLEAGTSIGGLVQDESGTPVEGVTVFLNIFWSPGGDGRENVTTDIWDRTCVTDAAGRWHFDEAPSDLSNLFFRLKHPDFVEELHFKKAENSVERFRNGAAVLRLERGIRVEGVVTDQQGHPLANAEILPGKDRVCSGTKPSFRTDAAGAFSIPLSPQRHASLTVKAEGHSPALLQFLVAPNMGHLRISLEPGRKIRARVVNITGAPVSGAHIFADTWREHRTLEWHTQADEDGQFEWSCAPPDEVQFSILHRSYRPEYFIPLTASEEDQTVVLRKALLIHGAVTDGRTGRAIDAFRIIPGRTYGNHRTQWAYDRGIAFSAGKYEWSIEDPPSRDTVFLLRVEADGYLPAVSQIQDSGEEAIVGFHLQPGPAATGRVLGADGTPAGNATVVIVTGNPAHLNEDKLQAGHGNRELITSSDGTFSFPSQEPPYAIVVAHALGFAIITADEFAREPVLRLQPWGGVEITADGAGSAESSIPFYLHYSDLPKDAQNMPWVTVQPVGKRRAENRIVFDKLPAGKALLGRYGQSNHDALSIVIESSKTIALDFDRGDTAGGERVPGAAVIKVIDEAGHPVAGAVVESSGFRLKSQPGSHFSAVLSTRGRAPLITNSHGVVTVGYPQHVKNDWDVESITVQVLHPDFCPARSDCPIAGEALPIVLKRGATVRVSGFFEGGGMADPIYAQIVSSDRRAGVSQDTWTAESGGILVNRQLPPGQKLLRLACFPHEGRAHFSEVVEVMAVARHPLEFRLALKPGVRFHGKLDDTVPRPVRDGKIHVDVLTYFQGAPEPMQWHTWTELQSDGSFAFDSLPPGKVELIALCDGFASKDPPGERPHFARIPQTFQVGLDGDLAVVAMERTATVRVDVRDQDGRPVAGASSHFSPNVLWAGRYSGLFAGAGIKTEELLQLASRERQQKFGGVSGFHGTTDNDGVARIPNLPSGKQYFSVFCNGYEMESPDGRGRREVDLSAGEVRNVSVVMHKIIHR